MGLGNKIKEMTGFEGNVKETLRPMCNFTCANITIGGAGYPLNQFHQQFLAFVEGMSTYKAGLISLIAGLWDAISDPLMGIITDRTKTKLGRHRPYLIIAALPFAVVYIFKWTSFGISGWGNDNATWVWYLAAALLYNTFMTMLSIPHTAMLPTVAPSYFERSQYRIVEYMMNSVGQITSYIFAGFVLSGFSVKTMLVGLPVPDAADRPQYTLVGIVLAVWFLWAPVLSFFKTKEPSSVDQINEKFDFKHFINEYRLVFKSRAFWQYFIMSLFFSMSRYFCSFADQYFMTSVTDTYNLFITMNIVSGISEFCGSPLNFVLSRYKGKTIGGKILGPLMVFGIAINSFINYTTPKWIRYTVIVISSICYNFGFSGPGFAIDIIQPDITDVDELITGRRREGVIATFSTFFKKTVSSVMGFSVGAILQVLGYNPDIKAPHLQSRRTNLGLRACYAVIPAILALFCVISVYKYSMTKEDHEEIKRVIKEKHETGTCSISETSKKRLEKISGQKWNDMWIGQGNAERNVEQFV